MPGKPVDNTKRAASQGISATEPHAPPLYLTSVWHCQDIEQAERLLGGPSGGYVYQRDGHPNADTLAEQCRALHAAERAVMTSSGMSALVLAVLSQLQQGDHILLSDQLYGRSQLLLNRELPRLGISSTVVDTCDLSAVEAGLTAATRLVVVETLSNPRLRVANLAGLAELAHCHEALLLVDNTFASPVLCRPLKWGADLVLESLTKIMNGHSDVTLGLLCGPERLWERVPAVLSTWGLTSKPLDCWLAQRGLATLELRVGRASDNAAQVARFLQNHPRVAEVDYPGLPSHADYQLATAQFGGRYGSVVTFHLMGGRQAADALVKAAAEGIPFCPSLGETTTTLSHPETTSHRSLSAAARKSLGIGPGTVRLSVGIEPIEGLLENLARGLEA